MAKKTNPVGRPPTRPEEERRRRGPVIGFQITDEEEARIEAIAAETGQTKSDVSRSAVLDTIRPKPYGRSGTAFIGAFDQLMRAVVVNARPAPDSDWLSDATTFAAVKAALTRFLDRFPTPPGEPARGVIEVAERRADELLWNLGTVDDVGHGPWAATVRADLGEATATRLIEKREADRAALLAGPPRDSPASTPEHAALLHEAFASVPARIAAEGGVVEIIKAEIARLAEGDDVDARELAFARSFLRYRIRSLETDPATRAELLAQLAKTAPEVGFGAYPAGDPAAEK